MASTFTLFNMMWFLPWGFIKDHVHISLLPADLPDKRNEIQEVIASITSDTFIKVLEGLAYQLDLYHVTNGAHNEYL